MADQDPKLFVLDVSEITSPQKHSIYPKGVHFDLDNRVQQKGQLVMDWSDGPKRLLTPDYIGHVKGIGTSAAILINRLYYYLPLVFFLVFTALDKLQKTLGWGGVGPV